MILARTESSAPTSPRTVTIGALSKLPCMVVRQGEVENETRAGNTTDAILGGSLGAASMPPRRQRGHASTTSPRPASPDVCDDEEAPHKLAPRQTEQERTRGWTVMIIERGGEGEGEGEGPSS